MTSSIAGALFLVASLSVGATVGCSSSSSGDACPAAAPTPNDACSLAESIYCTYGDVGACGGTPPTFTCRQGRWNEAAEGDPLPLACPATKPAIGSACETSCGAYQTCGYGECNYLECANGKWEPQESVAPCIVDAGVDASSNDAGDGGNEPDAASD
ncbi:MAG: hypothetical protein ABI551_14650, partial [Polyangiaceae bacterium]